MKLELQGLSLPGHFQGSGRGPSSLGHSFFVKFVKILTATSKRKSVHIPTYWLSQGWPWALLGSS